jgi:Flp pilus assembly pilin Flp
MRTQHQRVRGTKTTADSPRAGARGLRADQRGISTVEYLLLLVIILAGSIAGWNRLSASLNRKVSESTKLIDGLETGAAVEPAAGSSNGQPSKGILGSATDAIRSATDNWRGPSGSAADGPSSTRVTTIVTTTGPPDKKKS